MVFQPLLLALFALAFAQQQGALAASCSDLTLPNRCGLVDICEWDVVSGKCGDAPPPVIEDELTQAPQSSSNPGFTPSPTVAPVQCNTLRTARECNAQSDDCFYVNWFGCINKPPTRRPNRWNRTPQCGSTRLSHGRECNHGKRLHLERAFKRCRYSHEYDDVEDDDAEEYGYIPKNLTLKQLWCEIAPQLIRNNTRTCVNGCWDSSRGSFSGLKQTQDWCNQMDRGTSLAQRMKEYGCETTCDEIIASGLLENSEMQALVGAFEDGSSSSAFTMRSSLLTIAPMLMLVALW